MEYLSESSPRQRRDSSGECCFTSGASRFRFECSGEERRTAARHTTFLFDGFLAGLLKLV